MGVFYRGKSIFSWYFLRETKPIRLRVTRVRNSIFLNKFVSTFVPIGATNISGMWREYNGLRTLGYVHKTVNHKINFVNPNDNTIHSNNIERIWLSLREWLPLNLGERSVEVRLKWFEGEDNMGINLVKKILDFVILTLKIDLNNE